MSVELITWFGLCEMYRQFVESDDIPASAINPYIEAFAKAMHSSFTEVLEALYNSYIS